MRKKQSSELSRMGEASGIGAILGPIGELLAQKPTLKGALLKSLGGAASFGAAQGIGDTILGKPEDEGSFGQEALRGLVGGAAVGLPIGFLKAGKDPKALQLMNFLMQKGMSHEKAAATVLGAGATGAAIGGGLDKGIILGLQDRKDDDEPY